MRRFALALLLSLSAPTAAIAEAPVDSERYQLQMEGIAAAFEDSDVQQAILSGPRRAMLLTLVVWSDKPRLAIPWTRIAKRTDAAAFAAKVRRLPREASEFTCMADMLRFVYDKVLPRTPAPASRSVVDVSGDGRDNCNTDPVGRWRDTLVASGVTLNGLPILEGREAATLADWYRAEVIGGAGAFLLPAHGFADFARAIRQKFITEISALAPTTFEGGRAASPPD